MYKIVIDSCGELPEELKQDGHYETVSLELEVDGCRIKDDSTFNQLDFLRRVKESLKGPKSSCPSPEQYMDAYEGEADHVYVVTLSGGLSGSYNSAGSERIFMRKSTQTQRKFMCSIQNQRPSVRQSSA